jgi:hypothetical protein
MIFFEKKTIKKIDLKKKYYLCIAKKQNINDYFKTDKRWKE